MERAKRVDKGCGQGRKGGKGKGREKKVRKW